MTHYNTEKILVIQFRTDQSLEHEQACILKHTGLSEDSFEFYNLCDAKNSYDDLYEKIYTNPCPVIIGGSGEFYIKKKNATQDGQERIDELLEKFPRVLNLIMKSELPLLGLCFGHQVMAEMLGAVVEESEQHKETGIFEISQTQAGLESPIMKNLPFHFNSVIGHHDSVIAIPSSMKHLCSSQRCAYQGLQYNNYAFSFQFHPELDAKGLEERLALYPGYKTDDSIKVDQPNVDVVTTILKNFVEIAGVV